MYIFMFILNLLLVAIIIIMQENIPDTVTGRYYHSLSVWSVTPTTIWIIVFGGGGGIEVIELSEYM